MMAPSTIGIGRHRLAAERRHAEAFARWLQLDRLDGARSDVEPDDSLGSTKHTLVFGVGLLSYCPLHGTSPTSGDRSPETGEGQGRKRNRCAISSANRFAGFPAQSVTSR